MTRQILIIIFTISTTLFGCDFSKQVNDKVEKGVKDAKGEMNSDIANARSGFMESYNKVLEKSTDTILSTKVTDLYSSISKTSEYIDSLRTEMDQLDNMDVNNVELIRRTFLINGIGDSVFNKVKLSYSLAINIALADTAKSRLKNVQDTYSIELQKQLFGLSAPLGVYMTLYGIESELIRDGTRSLYGYETRLENRR